MRKILLLLPLVLLFAVNAHGQTILCQTTSGAWGPCPLNASVQLFSAVAATGTQTATAQKVYNFSMSGNLLVTWASITGSPSGCTLQIKTGDSLGNLINNGSAIAVTPANGTSSTVFTPATTQQTADEISVVYACATTYPSTGTLSLEFVPATISMPLDASGNLKINIAAQTLGKVLVTPDALPANQSVNVNQVAGASTGATNPLYEALADGTTGPVAVKAASTSAVAADKSLVVQFSPNTPNLTTPLNVALAANQSVNEAQINGVTPLMNNGVSGTGSQRINVASDNSAIANWGHGATGSAVPVNATMIGGRGSGNLTAPIVCDNWTPFSLASTTSLKLVSKVAAKQVYICSIHIVSAAANNVALIEGTKTTTDCDTSTAGMAGGTTAATGWNFAANGGLAQGAGIGVIAATATANHDVCLLASATGQLSGVISWTQF